MKNTMRGNKDIFDIDVRAIKVRKGFISRAELTDGCGSKSCGGCTYACTG